MPGYVDGFVIPLKKSKVKAYLAQARLGARVWKDHGALGYFECVGEDLAAVPGSLGFVKLARLKAGETVVFSWIVYRSRAHRDRVNKAVMQDARMQDPAMMAMAPFDPRRIAVGGFEVLVAKGAARLLARMVAPAVTELELSGDALVGCAPARLPDLFGGAPALLPVELAPRGGTLTLRGRTATGPFARTLQVPAAAAAEAPFAARFGRELVEDLELRAAAGEALDGEIEAAGLAFQISTRRTSWVAISAEATVDPRQPTRNETMPQALPYGMSVEGLGLRAGASTKMAVACAMSVAPSMDFEAEEAMQLSAGELLADLRRSAPPPAPPPAASPRADAPLGGAEKKKEHAARMPPKRRRGAARAIHLAARVNVATSSTLVIEADVSEPLFWLAYPEVVLVLGDGTELTLAVDLDRTTAEGRLAAGTTIRLVLRLEAPLPSGVALLRIEPDNGLVLELEAP